MHIAHFEVSNYRALKSVSADMGLFVCLIGRNNAGKSTLLRALQFAVRDQSLGHADFYDPGEPVEVTVCISELQEPDLERVGERHRDEVRGMVKDGSLTLRRRWDKPGETSTLLYETSVPKDQRLRPDFVAQLVKDKKAPDLKKLLAEHFPELPAEADVSSQTKFKAVVAEHVATLADEDLEAAFQPIPTGIPNSIKPLLPEPLYIPAVKDLTDELKSKDAATLGKVLGILSKFIERDLEDIAGALERLNTKLNKVPTDGGDFTDDRAGKIVEVERRIEQYVQESFADISLEMSIPLPQVKQLLSTAKVEVDDGVKGSVESKGDGLLRAVFFAVMRSYAEFAREIDAEEGVASAAPYLLLFEEPELYLHPAAQKVLVQALRTFAGEHQVVISSHSPTFFGTASADSYMKLVKRSPADERVPYSDLLTIHLSGLDDKQQFQLIGYENNNTAFFSDAVVLVEGASDALVFEGLMRQRNPGGPIPDFVPVGGKTNVAKYRTFFEAFEIPVAAIVDLDSVADEGFRKLGDVSAFHEVHAQLLHGIDELVAAEVEEASGGGEGAQHQLVLTGAQATSMKKSGDFRGRCTRLLAAVSMETHDTREIAEAAQSVLDFHARASRRGALVAPEGSVRALKEQLLQGLAADGIFVLEHGAVEEYYPAQFGGDKVEAALAFARALAEGSMDEKDLERGFLVVDAVLAHLGSE